MRIPTRALTIALALPIAALLSPVTLAATKDFCLVGPGDGIGWSWRLTDTGSSNTCQDLNVAGVTGNENTVADRFVASINGSCSGGGGGGLFATAARLNAAELALVCPGFPAGMRVWGGGTSPLDLAVGTAGGAPSCSVPDAPAFCNFNPDISGAPPFQENQGATAIPALQPWHYVAIVVLIGLAGGMLAWRRFA